MDRDRERLDSRVSLRQQRQASKGLWWLCCEPCLQTVGKGNPSEGSQSQGSRPEMFPLAQLPESASYLMDREAGLCCVASRGCFWSRGCCRLEQSGSDQLPRDGLLLGWEVGTAQHLMNNQGHFWKLTLDFYPLASDYYWRLHFNWFFITVFIIKANHWSLLSDE